MPFENVKQTREKTVMTRLQAYKDLLLIVFCGDNVDLLFTLRANFSSFALAADKGFFRKSDYLDAQMIKDGVSPAYVLEWFLAILSFLNKKETLNVSLSFFHGIEINFICVFKRWENVPEFGKHSLHVITTSFGNEILETTCFDVRCHYIAEACILQHV